MPVVTKSESKSYRLLKMSKNKTNHARERIKRRLRDSCLTGIHGACRTVSSVSLAVKK